VFEGAMPSINLLLQTVGVAGASKLHELLMRSPAHRSQVLMPNSCLVVYFFHSSSWVFCHFVLRCVVGTPLESGYVNLTRCTLSLNEMICNSSVFFSRTAQLSCFIQKN